jgi:hypothetical protein
MRKRNDVMMKEISEEEQERLSKLLRHHQRSLKAHAGVRSVGIGYAFKDDKPTNELAFIVVVDRKVPLDCLARKDRIPREIGGIRVDVMAKPKIPLLGPKDRHDPLTGGIQIRSPQGAGTLGCIVFDNETAQPYGLTNEHVVIPQGSKPTSYVKIFQPLTGPQALIGRYVRSHTKTDSALISVDGNDTETARGINTGIFTAVSAPSKGVGAPVIGKRVRKFGITTNLTFGIIKFISIGEGWFSVFPDRSVMSMTQPFVAAGDSGSVIFDSNSGQLIGLLSGALGITGDPNIDAQATIIDNVTRALKCFVYNMHDKFWVNDPPEIGAGGCVLLITEPNTKATLSVTYPSGRNSTAKGLGEKQADSSGILRWIWRIGTHTKKRANDPVTGGWRYDCYAQITFGSSWPEPLVRTFRLRGTTDTT